MAKKEREFLTELRKSFEREGVFFYKIADAPHFDGMRSRFDKPKPFAIEAKYIPRYRAFGVGALRDCQVDGLNSVEKSGGESFVFLNVRGKGRGRVNRLIIFEWSKFRVRANLKKAELESLPYIEAVGGLFDVSEFVERFS